MRFLRTRYHYLLGSTKGLVLVSIALISLVTGIFGMLSGPMQEFGVSAVVIKALGLKMMEADREGRIIAGYAALNSISPFGLYDMAGNVWQCVGDVYENQHYRYMRGGSKENYGYNLRVWTRNSAGPLYYSPNVGVRCAR